jgi:microcystin degradation protein MlrC
LRRKVLLAGLYHETNTFLRGTTGSNDFEVKLGEELYDAAGDASPLSGVLEVAQERGWDLVPLVDMRAMPGATVSDEVVESFLDAFVSGAESGATREVDGVYLDLHGAMVSESLLDVEGEILSHIRRLRGLAETPLCGVFDLHANFTAAMAENSNGLIAYRENPHTDAKEVAVESARLLDRLMETGERPVTLWEQPPVMWPPSGTGTATDPMRGLEEKARSLESERPGLLALNVLAGFPFADVPEAGVGFSAITLGDHDHARDALKELCDQAISDRETGNRTGMPLNEAMQRVREHRDGPLLIVEPSDNIGAGTPGENTHLLKAFVEEDLKEAGVIINDPQAVQELQKTPPGASARVTIGGKSGEIGAEPLTIEVQVIRHSKGHFVLEDRQSHLAAGHGERIDMGPCALVRHGGVLVLLTSRRTPPFDLGQWRSQGVDPEKLSVIGVKAAAAHRRAYDPIATTSYSVDVPGPCAENLSHLPYRRVRRPVFPRDTGVKI